MTPLVAILTYHALDDSDAVTSVRPERFRAHLDALTAAGFRFLDLDHVVEWLRSAATLPPRAAVLTFDDGDRSAHAVALPELRRRGHPATLFLTTGHCDGHNDWPSQPPGVPRREMLRVEEVGELRAAGWTIGAHSVTHPSLTGIDPEAARREIDDSRRWLEERLGEPIRHFAYPYGDASETIRNHVANGFSSACGTDLGLVRSGDDRYLLPRIDAYYLDGILRLGGLHSAWGRFYLLARHSLRRVRAAGRRRTN